MGLLFCLMYIHAYMYVCACACAHIHRHVIEEQLSHKYFIPIYILKMSNLGLFYEFDFWQKAVRQLHTL